MPIRLESIELFPLDAPIARPVRNSFRTLTSRSALFLRVRDADGATGWGEVWCNYPPKGSLHRANLIEHVAAPIVVGRDFDSPGAVFRELERQFRVPAVTCGEPGSFAQIAAGIDIALWDLTARRAGEPLWKHLGGQPSVRVYASGVSPDGASELIPRAVENGYRAAKLKVGFGADADRQSLRTARDALGDGKLMVDVNQKWTVEDALRLIPSLTEHSLEWVEEPMPADEPLEAWRRLAAASPIPLAAGENLRSRATFDGYVDGKLVRYLQPDIGKWGGFTECLPLGRRAISAGMQFCPHWLGGAVGLLASLHLLGAAGAVGWGEVDANPNPLQQQFLPDDFAVRDGLVTLSNRPGIGFEPDEALLESFRLRV